MNERRTNEKWNAKHIIYKNINRLDLDWLMFLFLISNCLTVIEVVVSFGTEPGPACGKFAIVRVDTKVGAHMPYFFFQHKRMNWFLVFNIVKILTFVEVVMKC